MNDTLSITMPAARLAEHWRTAADRAGAVPALIPLFDGVNRAAREQLGAHAWNLDAADTRLVALPAREGAEFLRIAA